MCISYPLRCTSLSLLQRGSSPQDRALKCMPTPAAFKSTCQSIPPESRLLYANSTRIRLLSKHAVYQLPNKPNTLSPACPASVPPNTSHHVARAISTLHRSPVIQRPLHRSPVISLPGESTRCNLGVCTAYTRHSPECSTVRSSNSLHQHPRAAYNHELFEAAQWLSSSPRARTSGQQARPPVHSRPPS